VHVVDFGISVIIHSMQVRSGDLIHADRHGAVVYLPVAIHLREVAFRERLKIQSAPMVAIALEAWIYDKSPLSQFRVDALLGGSRRQR
jgi:regulator of RNase E activity RraA